MVGQSANENNGRNWSAKTRRTVRGSLVSLSLYAQNILKAIPDRGQTEFQKVRNPKGDTKPPVDIYSADELTKLFATAAEQMEAKLAVLFPKAA